jgi:hypothetical protein
MISPATADVMATFHSTNETLGAFVTSVYLLGYSFGPLVIAPLSEIYGRAIVYNVCNFSDLQHCLCARQQSQRSDRVSPLCRYRCVVSHHAWGGDDCRYDTVGEAWIGYGVLDYGTTGWTDFRAFGWVLSQTFLKRLGLTMSSRWLSCPSQGLALDFLAPIYPCKFQDPAK